MTCRSLTPCSAMLFLTPGSPGRAGPRFALTLRSAARAYWTPQTVAAGMRFLHAPGILCASARAHFRLSRTLGRLVLAVSVRSQFGAPRRVLTLGCACVFASSLLLLVLFVVYDISEKLTSVTVRSQGCSPTHICTQCIYKDKGYLCDTCARSHKCGEEMLLPLVNSPRAGVCGYTGQDPAYSW